MRKIILMLLLTVVSNSAMAEWVLVGGDYAVTYYVDPTTIHKSGNFVRMWDMIDKKMPIELAVSQVRNRKNTTVRWANTVYFTYMSTL